MESHVALSTCLHMIAIYAESARHAVDRNYDMSEELVKLKRYIDELLHEYDFLWIE